MSAQVLNITTRTKLEQPRIQNMIVFINQVTKPYTIKLIRLLESRPQTYTELMHQFGLHKNKSKFAYYIRKAQEAELIKHDKLSRLYYLTFKGLKACELTASVEKIANLGIDSLEDAATKLILDLNHNKHWLEPVIRDEMQKAVREICKR